MEPSQPITPIYTPITNPPGRLKLSLIAAAYVPFYILVYMLLAFPVRLIINTAGGLSGFALALVFTNLLQTGSAVLAVILVGIWLKKLSYKAAFPVTVYAGLALLATRELVDIASSNPWVSLPLVTIIIVLAVNFFYWWFNTSLPLNKALRYLVPLLVLVAIYVASLLGIHYSYKAAVDNRILKRNFQIYSSSQITNLDLEYLITPGETTVPHSRSSLRTPLGEIIVRQTAWDDNMHKLLIPPDKCDYQALADYVVVGGAREKTTTRTTKVCQTVSKSPDGKRILMAPRILTNILSDAPYVAIIDDTVLVFHAFSSSGQFKGTPQEAAKYILDFVAKAKPLSDEELGL